MGSKESNQTNKQTYVLVEKLALLTKVLELSVVDSHEISSVIGLVGEATKVEHNRFI